MTSPKYDVQLEKEIQQWMESVLGEPFPEGQTFAEALKDGRRLCTFLNKIKPGTVKKIETSKMPMVYMQNTKYFLEGCRDLGVPSFDCFETLDLFEEKNMAGVLRCLDSLGRVVQKNVPDFEGPHFGAKLADANPRNFDEATLNKNVVNKLNMGSAQTMERRGFDISTSVDFGHKYAGASKSDAPTFLTTGDATVLHNAMGIDAATATGSGSSPKSAPSS